VTDPLAAQIESNRFIQFGCRLCGDMSPVCDQKEDVMRRAPAEWYQHHLATKHSHPAPAIVRAEGQSVQGYCGEGHPTDTLPCPHCAHNDAPSESPDAAAIGREQER
jgi:hypothetical protein